MGEREAFLTAIARDFGDDATRLVYADWLTEFGADDHDAATAEFIRVSAPWVKSGRIRPKAKEWLGNNWKRLVPNTRAVPWVSFMIFERGCVQKGRQVWVGLEYQTRVQLHFQYGFLTAFEFHGDWWAETGGEFDTCRATFESLMKALRRDAYFRFYLNADHERRFREHVGDAKGDELQKRLHEWNLSELLT